MKALSVEQVSEVDQLSAAIRDMAAIVLGIHAFAGRGAVRISFTYAIGDVEILVGHDLGWPDDVVVIIEGPTRQVYRIDARTLPIGIPGDPEHLSDTRDAIRQAIEEMARKGAQ